MRFAAALLLLVPGWAQAPLKPVAAIAAVSPQVTRPMLAERERHLDEMISQIGAPKDPFHVLGLSRGLYLDGYGVVFTLEGDLIASPVLFLFRPTMSPDEVAQVRQRKMAQLPVLRKALRDVWTATASALTALPADDQVVISVRLFYQKYEDTKGMPEQITLKATRRAGLAGDIQTEEQ